MADFKIQCWPVLSATLADKGYGLTSFHMFAGLFEQCLVVAIEAHITFAMIDDHQQAVTFEPVGKQHFAIGDGLHALANATANQQPFPA